MIRRHRATHNGWVIASNIDGERALKCISLDGSQLKWSFSSYVTDDTDILVTDDAVYFFGSYQGKWGFIKLSLAGEFVWGKESDYDSTITDSPGVTATSTGVPIIFSKNLATVVDKTTGGTISEVSLNENKYRRRLILYKDLIVDILGKKIILKKLDGTTQSEVTLPFKSVNISRATLIKLLCVVESEAVKVYFPGPRGGEYVGEKVKNSLVSFYDTDLQYGIVYETNENIYGTATPGSFRHSFPDQATIEHILTSSDDFSKLPYWFVRLDFFGAAHQGRSVSIEHHFCTKYHTRASHFSYSPGAIYSGGQDYRVIKLLDESGNILWEREVSFPKNTLSYYSYSFTGAAYEYWAIQRAGSSEITYDLYESSWASFYSPYDTSGGEYYADQTTPGILVFPQDDFSKPVRYERAFNFLGDVDLSIRNYKAGLDPSRSGTSNGFPAISEEVSIDCRTFCGSNSTFLLVSRVNDNEDPDIHIFKLTDSGVSQIGTIPKSHVLPGYFTADYAVYNNSLYAANIRIV